MSEKIMFTRREKNFLKKGLESLTKFLIDKSFFKFERKIEVTVERSDKGYIHKTNYHAGNTQFPFEFSSKIVGEMQKNGEEILNKRKDFEKGVSLSYADSLYIFKPYFHIKKIMNKLKD